MMLDFTTRHCSAKNGTFGTLQMLLSQEVDVVFGPVCSSGTMIVTCNKQQTQINAVKDRH